MTKIIGKNGISATIIADSVSGYSGQRIITFELEYHRLFHSEFMTHRALSKNAMSSRAVPMKAMHDLVLNHPAIPVYWGANQAGMQAQSELSPEEQEVVKAIWIEAMGSAVEFSRRLFEAGLHKQLSNRLTECFQMMKVVCTGTDFDNLQYLRNDEEAQPEFHVLADCMQKASDASTPAELFWGEWHLPYVNQEFIEDREFGTREQQFMDSNGEYLDLEDAKKISASCCAQVSYRKLNDTQEKALDIYNKLFSGRKPHMSPTEHQATPICYWGKNKPFEPITWEEGLTHVDRFGRLHSGNLVDWIQYRQTLPNNVYVKETYEHP